MTAELLNVIDEQGRIIGTETRDKIHREGLLHREISVWFYTPDAKLIFQQRSLTKQTSPGLLGAAVAGHVGLGDDFINTALKETKEETGLTLTAEDLQFIQQIHLDRHDSVTGARNNFISHIYAYRYEGNLEDLHVEPGEAEGFEAWPIRDLYNLPPDHAKRFSAALREQWYQDLLRKIEQLVGAPR
jgi:isopentenyldiphosphate isomerase